MKNNPLLDTEFLKKLDAENQREIFAKVISLTAEETPIEQIEGRVTGGTINIDGSSAIRRSCSLQLVAEDININNFYWGLTNKFKLYIGLTNTIDSDYDDIIWFPQGIFLITTFNTTRATNSYKISINGKDKMCLLNGDIGGNFPNPIDFAVERIYTDDGNYQDIKKPISYIIREMIHHYGNEPFHNIIIRDIDEIGLELLEYMDGDFYAFLDDNDYYVNISFDPDLVKYDAKTKEKVTIGSLAEIDYTSLTTGYHGIKLIDSIDDKSGGYYITRIKQNQTAGYRTVDLVWPTDDGLMVEAGETVTSVLDKIKSTFGEYEYFYDIDGKFIFQRKQTYVNKSWNNIVVTENSANTEEDAKQRQLDYAFDKNYQYNQKYEDAIMLSSKVKYNLANNKLISSFQHTPDFTKIKNNFMIWGRKNPVANNSEGKPLHLRYAIDEKPISYTTLDGDTYSTLDPLKSGEFVKTPNPIDTLTGEKLSEDWWDIKDWAELYKKYFGYYPTNKIGKYYDGQNGGDYLDLNTLFGPSSPEEYSSAYDITWENNEGSSWTANWEFQKIYVFDLLPSGHLGYLGHGPQCSHYWEEWFAPLYAKGGKAYIYKPVIPDTDTYYTFDDNNYSRPNNKKGITIYRRVNQDWRELIYQMALDYQKYGHDDDYAVRLAKANPQYKYGRTGYESYYADLLAFWRDLYDPTSEDSEKYFIKNIDQVENEYYGWNKNVRTSLENLEFWMDFLEAKDTDIGKYSVRAIGDRPKIVNNDAIKSIIYSETPNIIYISPEKYEMYKKQNMLNDGYTYMPLPALYENKFKISNQSKSAYDELNDLLYQYAYMNEKVTIKAIPIYYLEPNTIITIEDNDSQVHGEYIINKITLQLTHNGTMSLVVTKAPVRLM